MRLFLTINLNQAIREEVDQSLPLIKQQFKGKFVPKENWHVTMLFLGDVKDQLLPQLEKAMELAIQDVKPFVLYLDGIGAFPSIKKPNILWAGVKGDLEPLQLLYEKLLVEIKKTKIPFDAKPKYTPHLTLARKVERVITNGDPFKQISLTSTTWEVNALECYQSVLTSGGPIYKNILDRRFGKNE